MRVAGVDGPPGVLNEILDRYEFDLADVLALPCEREHPLDDVLHSLGSLGSVFQMLGVVLTLLPGEIDRPRHDVQRIPEVV